MRRRSLAAFGAILCLALMSPSWADVTLPALITDNMVVQRQVPIHLWGHADPGEAVTVMLSHHTDETVAAPDGDWDIHLKPLAGGGPYTLTVAGKNTLTIKNVLVGEVWVCSGQSNMSFGLESAVNGKEAVAASANPNLRIFHVPLTQSDTPLTDVKASWVQASPETMRYITAVGYFFGRDLQKDLHVPIGLIQADCGGTAAQYWTPTPAMSADPLLKKTYVDSYAERLAQFQKDTAAWEVAAKAAQEAGKPPPYKPDAPWRYSTLYDGMIAPLTKYPVRGAIWYQGENNTDNPTAYGTLLPALILGWRSAWNNSEFPFLIVQLAPYETGGAGNISWAELRQAQAQTAQTVPHTGLAVITDVGEQKDIHPKQKEPVGARLALLARKIAYGEKLFAQGPTLKTAARAGQNVILHFDNIGDGLISKGGLSSGVPVPEGTLVGFTLAGADGSPRTADARITGKNTIIVSSPQVTQPTTVAYGFVNFPVVNLWNKSGLPATPFRLEVK